MAKQEIVSQGSYFSDLAKQAWNSLKGKWLITIGAFLLVSGIQFSAGFIPILGKIAGLLLFPLSAGIFFFTLKLVRREDPLEINLIFEPLKLYWHYVWGYLRVCIFVFLWTLLLIIPGIIAGLRFSMTFYVMLDHPEYSAKEAMTESSAIMYGHKWQFFGYSLLLGLIFMAGSLCTLGIGLFWLIPWGGTFNAAFYESIRRRPAEDQPVLEAAPDESAETENQPS